jgi:UDP-2,4-diacetamido-2,4,6-trideoxy-beta-L-altropyranose hydrolase
VAKISNEIILIRADASVTIGTGHVMRCLALAQAWQDAGGIVTFVMAESTTAIEQRLRSEHVELIKTDREPGSDSDGEELVAIARNLDPTWIVVDGYRFGAAYLRALKNELLNVVLIDDNGRPGTHASDFVLNQNIHAEELLYQDRENYTRLLLGTKYALLRREFFSLTIPRQISSVGRKLLVSMGGSDPENVTCRIMEAIEQVAVENLQVIVVAGGSNPHLGSIAESVANSRHSCRILNNVKEMQEVIAWADLAISAAGSTCWEYCALGLPAILVAVADNQVANAQGLDGAGAARLVSGGSRFAIGEMAHLIARLANSTSERQALSRTGRNLVDGRGAALVVSILIDGCASQTRGQP